MINATSEDDQLRSRYVYHLVHEFKNAPQDTATKIPRVLVQFWDDAEVIPKDVSECMLSWSSLREQSFQYILFNDNTAKQFIAQNFGGQYSAAFERCLHPAMRSDYFRLCFILQNGGVYIDADDVYQGGDCEPWFSDNKIKLHPLCYRISTDSMIDDTEIISSAYSDDLIFYINNNPLIAPPKHPVIHVALERATRILLTQIHRTKDIQSITGPGNLTMSLVQHAVDNKASDKIQDFSFLTNWDEMAVSKWPLEYRNDERNWRRWSTIGNGDSSSHL